MGGLFDILALSLFAATAGLFILRFRHENTSLGPYLVIAAVSIVGNWLGNHGGGAAAVCLLIAGSFLLLHLAGQPYREDLEEKN